MMKVLFVCAGNICRSPMAEAVFKDLVVREGLADQFEIDSVGTDTYHVGEPAHSGTRRILAAHNIRCDSISRRVTRTDLTQADYVIVMDRFNASDIQRIVPKGSLEDRISLLLSFANGRRTGNALDVPDPYYTGNFEEVFQLVKDGCQGLLTHIRQERGI